MAWYYYLIIAGGLGVLGTIIWLVFRYAKSGVGALVVSAAGGLAGLLAKLIPDKPESLDVHDIATVIEALATKVQEWVKDPTHVSWTDCKDDVLAFIEEQKKTIPDLAKLPKETIESIAGALFWLVTTVPGLFTKK